MNQTNYFFKQLLCCVILVSYNIVARAQTIDYKQSAKELYSSIQQNFYIRDSGYYREEAIGTHSEHPVSFLWPLCAMIQAGNEMDVAFAKNTYFKNVLAIVEKYRDSRLPAPGYASYKLGNETDDRYYDDNQWIGIASLDAYKRTRNRQFLQVGADIYRFMMTGYDTASGGGIYWVESKKESKNTCSNGPGALVALGMYEATGDKKYLDTAILIYNWTVKHLRAANGLYYDNYNIQRKKIDSAFYSYNAGTMLESAVWLHTITHQASYQQDALQTAQSAAEYFLKEKSFRDDYWFNAVMLRGYLRLFQLDHKRNYIDKFKDCLNYTLAHQKHSNGLFGKNKVDNLVGQGGLLEMLCRIAILEKK